LRLKKRFSVVGEIFSTGNKSKTADQNDRQNYHIDFCCRPESAKAQKNPTKLIRFVARFLLNLTTK